MKKYWDDDEFIQIIKNSKTIAEVLKYFGLPKNQGHYNRLFHKSVKRLNIDITHIKNNKQTFRIKQNLSEILVKGEYRSTSTLRQRLIKENILTNNCYKCGLNPEWNGEKLSLHLDHINGDNTDNRLENLRLLCPNCHSQTDTYCGANKKKKKKIYKCNTCGQQKRNHKSNDCLNCRNQKNSKKTKIDWPDSKIVYDMVNEFGFVHVGEKLNVSDNAVRKFLKRNNLISLK